MGNMGFDARVHEASSLINAIKINLLSYASTIREPARAVYITFKKPEHSNVKTNLSALTKTLENAGGAVLQAEVNPFPYCGAFERVPI